MTRKPITIYLPAIEKHCTIHQYCQGVKLAKANLDAEFKHGLTTWWPVKGRDIVKQFRDGMNERINKRANGRYRPIDYIKESES